MPDDLIDELTIPSQADDHAANDIGFDRTRAGRRGGGHLERDSIACGLRATEGAEEHVRLGWRNTARWWRRPVRRDRRWRARRSAPTAPATGVGSGAGAIDEFTLIRVTGLIERHLDGNVRFGVDSRAGHAFVAQRDAIESCERPVRRASAIAFS